MSVIIYRLFSAGCEKFYVGSTTRDLKQRFTKHRNKSYEAPNRKLYKYIADNGGFENWQMELLELIDEPDIHMRAMREQHWIDFIGAELNSIRCLA
jgi:hypothetical protein